MYQSLYCYMIVHCSAVLMWRLKGEVDILSTSTAYMTHWWWQERHRVNCSETRNLKSFVMGSHQPCTSGPCILEPSLLTRWNNKQTALSTHWVLVPHPSLNSNCKLVSSRHLLSFLSASSRLLRWITGQWQRLSGKDEILDVGGMLWEFCKNGR